MIKKKRSQVFTLILSIVIVTCSYLHIFYSHKISNLYRLDQLAIALSIYFLIQIRFRWNALINGLVFVFFAGITLLLLNIFHNKYTDQQLKMYGTKANAIVTSVKYMSGSKHYPGIIIKFTYTSKGRTYNKFIMDDVEDNRRFSVGDTLSIKYSSIDPDLFEEIKE